MTHNILILSYLTIFRGLCVLQNTDFVSPGTRSYITHNTLKCVSAGPVRTRFGNYLTLSVQSRNILFMYHLKYAFPLITEV